jgi:hypothetical protein
VKDIKKDTNTLKEGNKEIKKATARNSYDIQVLKESI